MSKKGITMASLVIYVLLLFSTIVLVSITSNTINKRVFDDKGLAINLEASNKLQYNIVKSSKDSRYIKIIANKIVFSNGDAYWYNQDKKVIYKNETALVDNVDDYTMTHQDKRLGSSMITINITFNKYLNELQREIKIYSEE